MENPSAEGWYVFKLTHEWPLRMTKVERGKWQLAQNPELLYALDGKPLSTYLGWWFGPLPEAGSPAEFVLTEASNA